MVNDLLLGTVEDVLGSCGPIGGNGVDRLHHRNRLVFEPPNDPEQLVTAIDLVTQMAAGMELLTVIGRYRVSQAMQHAAANALFRGNLELSRRQCQHVSLGDMQMESLPAVVHERLSQSPFKSRKIHFDARLMRDLIRVSIKDEGPGFDVRSWESQQQGHEGTAAFTGEVGRGFTLIHRFMDKVSFNSAGNEITLVKHCLAAR